MRTAVFLLIPAGLAAGALFGPTPPAAAVGQGEPVARPYAVEPKLAPPSPALSCAAASCHGGGQVGAKGSEHTTWAMDLTRNPPVAQDPHARAYRVLFNEDSVRIARLLGGLPAHLRHDCLSCHAVPGTDPHVIPDSIAEGVGCAACHGSDEKWLTVHYLPGWKALSNREKAAYGFTPTKNLVARATACAACHVGDSTREVNHDLIATGHPRLSFEYTRFHFSPAYRKHWVDPAPTADFEVRAWTVGQLASLRAALDLLRARATGAQKEVNPHPWPEFSEGSCFACHQSVARSPYPVNGKGVLRGTQGERTRPSGAVPWQPWYTSVATDPVVREAFGLSDPPVDVGELRAEMEKRSPDPRKVARLAVNALKVLDAHLATLQDAEDRGTLPSVTPEKLTALAAALSGGSFGAPGRLKDYDWDFLAQRYLGLAMTYHAAGGETPLTAGWRPPLTELRRVLSFPTPGVGRYDSPRTDFRPDAAVAPLQQLRTITTTRSGR